MPNQPPRSAPPPMQQPNMPNVGPTPDSRSATDQISGTLASMNPQQLYTLMTQMKVGVQESYEKVNKCAKTSKGFLFDSNSLQIHRITRENS